ncbi:MAG: hypothetical protein KDA80_13640 [Planctomycetaceae bacterium]|nr:hypothetical protein [Planctomycetaceae bacterium]
MGKSRTSPMFASGPVWLSFLFVLIFATSGRAETNPIPERQRREQRGIRGEEVTRSPEQQAKELAAALRSINQSYGFRGMRSPHAFTAGSIYIDWDAYDLPHPEDLTLTPPNPRKFAGDDGLLPVSKTSPKHQMKPELVPPRSPPEPGTLHIEFCIDLQECEGPDSIPILCLGEDGSINSPVFVDQYRGQLRLRLTTNHPDCFGSLVHEVNLGSFCGRRRIRIFYASDRLTVSIDGHSHSIEGIHGHLPPLRIDSCQPKVNSAWGPRLHLIHCVYP